MQALTDALLSRSALELYTVVGALLAFLVGLRQYREGQRWRRTEFLAEKVREFEARPRVVLAMRMLDWSARYLKLQPEGEPVKVTDEDLVAALQSVAAASGRYTQTEALIRDIFDDFLTEFERFDVYITTGLVSAKEVEPYLSYWIESIGAPERRGKPPAFREMLWGFLNDYDYKGIQSLCRRFGYDILPPLELKRGDVFLTQGRSLLSRLIRFFTRTIGESRTRVNHVGLVVEDGILPKTSDLGRHQRPNSVSNGGPKIIEAIRKVVERVLFAAYADGTTRVAVFRLRELTEEQKVTLVEAANKYLKRTYGYHQIVAHFLDWLLFGVFLFRRLTAKDTYPICSWLVANCFRKIGVDFGTKPGQASPDDIWDWVTAPRNSSQVRCVRELSEL